MIYDIQGQRKSHASAPVIMARVHAEIAGRHATIEQETGSTIEFTPLHGHLGYFRNTVFVSISRGIVEVKREADWSVLVFRLSLFRLRVIASIITIAGSSFAATLASNGEFTAATAVFLFVLFGAWIWIYGSSYLITSIRVGSFFDRLLANLSAEPPPLPPDVSQGLASKAESRKMGAQPSDAPRPTAGQ